MARITLVRPGAKNAVTPEMHEELCRLWTEFATNDDVDVAILTGVGDAFCAGADLATYVPLNYVDAGRSSVHSKRVAASITATAGSPAWSTRAAWGWPCRWC
ncbi:enoyl-CoA hydratase/isomerase family protein [Mycobacterium palustre]|uniref:enoyl-CoA hydratase/isomerase family protein n=1 Tax=Mycobacterium palustre TaxID=153971 RepID=UPI0027E21CDA|nr:enoyl-CoA hydratase/isomerase family protein [Mycobacterium palustre]